ncbi:alpha-mannosyltransferase [Limnohabitans sp. 2KL-1]|jgi:glycosyltransferase involved in cell wall biosynthesis|uniref:glycosyltransferase family 4 protein n=1 Tax=Limnohabitans sp. 2KL-1 TaxID=1100699 RepID=UPI000D349BD4|nr:glycosyltransferase family 1 protein [Limnohabitans sp. 2KL-1]PUE47965.1 alpha-mannosyltransferase [Limnohabitans sp. 2KL-1]
MKLALITDAWHPQVNGVVTTLHELVQALGPLGVAVTVVHPGLFKNRSCPGYAGIDLAIRPYKALAVMLDSLQPEAVHIATEGPLGWAARRHCLKKGWKFTTAFHTKFPEILKAALHVPLFVGYALFRHFHRPSAGVMVPTQGVLNMLKGRGFRALQPWTHGVDLDLFKHHAEPLDLPELQGHARPYALFVGRVSYEKNIDAFLDLKLPGTRIVCGVGPLEAQLKARYPGVVWMGVLPRQQLARVYAAADVFVFPSRNETFGLVMLEAMACGTPVAAYPVDGPLQVLGDAHGQTHGGALSEDLSAAVQQCQAVPRLQARERAQAFAWPKTVELFVSYLVPVDGSGG